MFQSLKFSAAFTTCMVIIMAAFIQPAFAQPFSGVELGRWKAMAQRVTIMRDGWGIPHIYGKSDADAVFGLLYAQCEDDFRRVEMNYIEKLGRMAEVKGDKEIFNDLLIRMIIDSADAVADYQKSEPWFKKLMNAYADGINYFLATHPQVHPALLTRFKPWYPLLWTDGSIGAISTGGIAVEELEKMYTGNNTSMTTNHQLEKEMSGSNGFALAPAKTKSHNAILYINPHVTFYFRPEVHMVSEAGMNVYGAVTWGQFFIYQGFNEHCGWMHTSSAVDVSDLYEEKLTVTNSRTTYEYDHRQLPVKEKLVKIFYREGADLQSRVFTARYTGHGPIMAIRNGVPISLRSYNRSLSSLMQSWLRTKTTGFDSFKKIMNMRSNTSNNTVFADAGGNIAYWHGNYVPRRDPAIDWSKPVDGSTSATEWRGLHTIDEIVHIYNPSTGFIQNCNSTPFSVSGTASPARRNYPLYMAPDGENFRAINAVKIWSTGNGYTIDKTITSAYDTYLAAFDSLLPALFRAVPEIANDSTGQILREAIDTLKAWNQHSSEHSVATTIAIYFGQNLMKKIAGIEDDEMPDQVTRTNKYARVAAPIELLSALREAVNQVTAQYGTWKTEWGSINRYQRLTGDLEERYDDNQPSLPSGMASSTWGCLPSFASRNVTTAKKRYGYHGNSFICAVEFGKHLHAKSLLAGGESGNPASPHFSDQALMYTEGKFKDVAFYREDVKKMTVSSYHPGEATQH